MLRVTSEVQCYMGEATYYLVVRIPIRSGRPPAPELPPPIVPNYELEVRPIIDSIRSVATRAERRMIDQVTAKIVGVGKEEKGREHD